MNTENPHESKKVSTTTKSSFYTHFSNFRRKISVPLLLMCILVLGLGIFLSYRYFQITHSFPIDFDSLFQKAEYLQVISVDPVGRVNGQKPDITIEFNLPVTAHHAQEYIEISPFIKGVFTQGKNRKEIVFKPSVPFSPGTYVSILLKQGLPSDAGKKLLYEYRSSFTTSSLFDTITFTSNGLTGKFLSFDQNQGGKIKIEVGSSIVSPIVKVYKVTPALLLQSLIYTVPKDNEVSYPREGTFADKEVDATRLPLVTTYTDVREKPEIIFNQKTGLYLFQALDGDKVIGQVWVTLNNSAVHFRQDDQRIYLAAQDLKTTQEARDLDVTFYSIQDKPTVIATKKLSGIQDYEFSSTRRLDLLLIEKDNDVLIVPVSIPNSQAEVRTLTNLQEKYQLFLYTDRPIYKKGDTLFYRGIVRQDNDVHYEVPQLASVRIFMYGTQNEKIIDTQVPIAKGGIFSGEFTLPKDLNSGTFYLNATTEKTTDWSGNQASAYFDIFEYTKPSFGLDVSIEKSDYIKGDQIKTDITGSYFSGLPFANQEVAYQFFKRDYYETEKAVYNSSFKLNGWGGMCGGGFGFGDEYYGEPIGSEETTILDKDGKASIVLDSKKLQTVLSQEITVLVQKKDENGNTILAAKSAVVHQGEFNIFILPGPVNFQFGEKIPVSFYAETLSGERLENTQFSYQIRNNVYGNERSTAKPVKEGTVITNNEGLGRIEEELPDEKTTSNSFMISIARNDSKNNTIEARQYLYVRKPDEISDRMYFPGSISQTVLKITSPKASLTVGSSLTLNIISPSDMVVFTTFERGRIYKPQWLNLKKGNNNVSFEVINDFVPSITPTFSFFYNGKYYIEGLSLNVPAMSKLLTIGTTMDKEKYKPGETALITIHVKDPLNNPVKANIGVGIIDKAIFALRKSTTQPLHSSFYYFRGRSTNSSSSLTWIATYNYPGRGGGGGGGDLFKKDVDTLYWNPNGITDDNGTLTLSVPVGMTKTTWKILIYASTDNTYLGQGDKEFLVTNELQSP